MERTGVRVRVSGIVQGVGFRPFIHRLVSGHRLCGTVRNTGFGAELMLEGEDAEIAAFLSELEREKPPLALIEEIRAEHYEPLKGFSDFRIIESGSGENRNTLISPDICTCEACQKELFDPENRRYRYPFINCTNCGPRFTIIRDIPYDRRQTTMAAFTMCGDCRAEYEDIRDRRYHAEPDCCPDCGPRLFFCDAEGREVMDGGSDDVGREGRDNAGDAARAVILAADLIRRGGIVAIKGLGGFHLACRADLPELARKLRERKHRDEKPFALMCADAAAARELCEVSEEEERLLTSPERPIVLLKKRKLPAGSGPAGDGSGRISDNSHNSGSSHISDNSRIGIMLPYTPVHFLLFAEGLRTLIMTSANLSDRPVISSNEEALRELSGIADGFLMNDRDIHVKCDDSVLWGFEGRPYFARRSRGYVPFPVTLRWKEYPEMQTAAPGPGTKPGLSAPGPAAEPDLPVLACGAEQKASFCLGKGNHAFLSQHIGDLKNIETLEHYESQIRHFERLFEIRPEALVCDLHPDYLSGEYAESRAEKEHLPLLRAQHHHAHMCACMADNGLDEPVIGIIWDGTGLGTDGTAWGGEFLTGDFEDFVRRGTLKSIPLPGGDRAVKEIWRTAAALLKECGLEEKAGILVENSTAEAGEGPTEEQLRTVFRQMDLGVNCPETSSIGRLFDGVSAILGIREAVSYEGQGAILLEAEACGTCGEAFPFMITGGTAAGEAGSPGAAGPPGPLQFDWRPMIRELIAEAERGRSRAELSAMFMNTLVQMAAEMVLRIQEKTGLGTVVLSGGSFQNLYILKRLTALLRERGMRVYPHSRVSCNDEGLSLGQMMIARRRLQSHKEMSQSG